MTARRPMAKPPGLSLRPARTYGVELLLREPPQIDYAALLERLREHCGRVAPMAPEKPNQVVFLHPEHTYDYTDRKNVPAQTFIALSDKPLEATAAQPAVAQSWDWPEVRGALPPHRATLLVTDRLASWMDYRTRLDLRHRVLAGVLDVIDCVAVHWQPSQRLVQPAAYRARRAGGDQLYPAINARLFHVTNGAKGETVMDTLGLNALGLPDLQCHFTGLDPTGVARVLLNAAYSLYEQGAIIANGHTLPGLAPGDRWRCQHEAALVAPERLVIDLDPGPPHAAGRRQPKAGRA